MNLSLTKSDLQSYVSRQLNNFFPDNDLINIGEHASVFDLAMDRIEHCFANMIYERYCQNGQAIFNHLYSDQYLVFIWFLANSFFKKNGENSISTKLYYLNKSLHSFDCMYDTQLPEIFFISHGVGTMLGKASYGDYFIALHGCTVGSHNGKYPKLGRGVTLTAHSSIIGNCNIGNKVTIANNTSVFERDIPDMSVAYSDRDSGKLSIKSSQSTFAKQVFKFEI